MDKNIIWQSALVGVGTAVAIAFQILPMLALWAGMLYLTQIILGINFSSLFPDIVGIQPLQIWRMFWITVIIIVEGMIAYFAWEKILGKIEKRKEENENK